MDLKEGYIIVVATSMALFLIVYLFKWFCEARDSRGSHACQCKHGVIRGGGDSPARRRVVTQRVSQRAKKSSRKARHNCTLAREIRHVDHPISKGKKELFSMPRKIALEEYCMAFENTLIMMIFIVLLCNLIPEQKQAIQKSYWQIFVDGIWHRLTILINYIYAFITQFGYLEGMQNF